MVVFAGDTLFFKDFDLQRTSLGVGCLAGGMLLMFFF